MMDFVAPAMRSNKQEHHKKAAQKPSGPSTLFSVDAVTVRTCSIPKTGGRLLNGAMFLWYDHWHDEVPCLEFMFQARFVDFVTDFK